MSAVEYTIAVGEASGAAQAFARRWGIAPWNMVAGVLIGLLALAAGVVITGVLTAFVEIGKTAETVVTFVVALIFAWTVGLRAWRAVCTRIYRGRLTRRGMEPSFSAAYRCTPDQLVYAIGAVEKTARWDVISEVFRAGGWWVLVAQGEPFYLPRRAFADPAAERAFMTGVFQYLGGPARLRSPELQKLVATT